MIVSNYRFLTLMPTHLVTENLSTMTSLDIVKKKPRLTKIISKRNVEQLLAFLTLEITQLWNNLRKASTLTWNTLVEKFRRALIIQVYLRVYMKYDSLIPTFLCHCVLLWLCNITWNENVMEAKKIFIFKSLYHSNHCKSLSFQNYRPTSLMCNLKCTNTILGDAILVNG